MKRSSLALLLAALVAAPAAAIEIRLQDGTVIDASSYTLTGSYLMVEMANGAQVAYDLADVDLDALRAQEEATTGPVAEQPPEKAPSLSQGRRLATPEEAGETAGLAITDQDVQHVKGSAVAAAEEAEEEEPGGVPEGYVQGGGVVINNLEVTAQGQDRWLVEGEVINRTADPVLNVRVQLQTLAGPGEVPWTDEVSVASTLQPNGRGVFSRAFSAPVTEDKLQPDVRASVIWMQHRQRPQEPPPGALRAPRVPGPIPTPEL